MLRGHTPFIPHLSHFVDERMQIAGSGPSLTLPSYAFWMEQNLAWLRLCDGLYFIGPSPGAVFERNWAAAAGLPIYLSINDIPPPLLKVANQQE